MPLVVTRECLNCTKQYDWLEHPPGEYSALDQPKGHDIEDLSCPGCGSEERKSIIQAGTAINTGGEAGVGKFYPRFDRGLGCHISSNAHRKRIMKARGLVAIEGDIDMETPALQRHYEHERRLARLNEMRQEEEDHPDFRDYRQLRDRGAYDDRRPRGQ